MAKFRERGAEEDVALVFVVVESTEEGGYVVDGFDACVVAGGDVLGVDGFGVLGEFAELEPVVAADAGVGSSTGVIFIDEVVDDSAKVLFEVEDVEGDIEFGGDELGVFGIVDGAATLVSDFDIIRIAEFAIGE